MDIASTILIESLGVSDMMLILVWYLPSLITLTSGRWVLGSEMCFLTTLIQYSLNCNEILLISLLSGYRLWKLHRPFRAYAGITKRHMIICVSSVMLFSFLASGGNALSGHIFYSPSSLLCSMATLFKMTPFTRTTGVLFLIMPLFFILGTNFAISFTVFKSSMRSGNSSTRTHIAIILISLAFVLSYVIWMMIPLGFHRSEGFDLLVTYSCSINAVTTPFITFVTIRPFRRLVWTKLRIIVNTVTGSSLSTDKKYTPLNQKVCRQVSKL